MGCKLSQRWKINTSSSQCFCSCSLHQSFATVHALFLCGSSGYIDTYFFVDNVSFSETFCIGPQYFRQSLRHNYPSAFISISVLLYACLGPIIIIIFLNIFFLFSYFSSTSLVKVYMHDLHRRRVSSVVKHSSASPKVPGSIPGPVSCQGHGL